MARRSVRVGEAGDGAGLGKRQVSRMIVSTGAMAGFVWFDAASQLDTVGPMVAAPAGRREGEEFVIAGSPVGRLPLAASSHRCSSMQSASPILVRRGHRRPKVPDADADQVLDVGQRRRYGLAEQHRHQDGDRRHERPCTRADGCPVAIRNERAAARSARSRSPPSPARAGGPRSSGHRRAPALLGSWHAMTGIGGRYADFVWPLRASALRQ